MQRKVKSDRKRPTTAMSSLRVLEPFPDDVILGKGSAHAWRPGNRRFHDILDQFADTYHRATSNEEKAKIIQTVYSTLSRYGRFLVKHPEADYYVEIDERDAKRRAGQAMRYRMRRNTDCTLKESIQPLQEETTVELAALPTFARFAAPVPAFPPPPPPPSRTSSFVAPGVTSSSTISFSAAFSFPDPSALPVNGTPEPRAGVAASGGVTEYEELFSDEELSSVLGHPSEYTHRHASGGNP